MARYLILEVVDEMHDLADFIEDMAENSINRRASLMGAGYNLSVRFPTRPLVQILGEGTASTVYVTEPR